MPPRFITALAAAVAVLLVVDASLAIWRYVL